MRFGRHADGSLYYAPGDGDPADSGTYSVELVADVLVRFADQADPRPEGSVAIRWAGTARARGGAVVVDGGLPTTPPPPAPAPAVGLSPAAVAGIAVGCVAAAGSAVGLAFWGWRKRMPPDAADVLPEGGGKDVAVDRGEPGDALPEKLVTEWAGAWTGKPAARK
ncbi:hypothetical protein DFJ74DRAFT_693633 [Hyaloraphidium curvatum]|nr:hypothetical protein DFJ74DRAFT_693633 [Hyaloraphidium curvatum]